jgi:cytochrome b subunit of formate dehydrogenase
MARLLTLAVLVAVTGWAVYAVRAGGGSLRGSLAWLVSESTASLGRVRVLFFAIAAGSVVVLALTGFIPYLLTGSVSGVSLVLHVAIAPAFAVCMTAVTLLWAHGQRFNARDLNWLSNVARRRKGLTESADTRRSPALKLFFWAMTILAPLIMGSIMLSMYPLFGTSGQRSLLTLHLASGLLFVVVAVAQIVVLVGDSNFAMNEREDPRDPAD